LAIKMILVLITHILESIMKFKTLK